MPQTANQPPFAELIPDETGDYTLTVFLTFDRQDDRQDGRPSLFGQYCVEAGRESGHWYLRVSPWDGTVDNDNVLTGPAVVDLSEQTGGTDPLTALRALLAGGSA